MKFVLPGTILLLSLTVVSCDSDPVATDTEITDVQIIPESATIEVGDRAEFSFEALTESGETVGDPDMNVRWWSTDTTVFTVDESGNAVAQGEGEAYCVVELSDLSKSIRFVGRDSASVVVFMF